MTLPGGPWRDGKALQSVAVFWSLFVLSLCIPGRLVVPCNLYFESLLLDLALIGGFVYTIRYPSLDLFHSIPHSPVYSIVV